MESNKKFGLLIPKKSGALKVKAKSVFESDSDSNDDAPKSKRPVIPQKKLDLKSKIKQEMLDPSIYEYDNIYDEMKAKQVESIAPKTKQNSRYIDTLMKAADKRKKEYERRLERKIQVEREKEGDQFKDKEEFVTSAYKKKMLEREEEEERERREAMLNDMMDVTKQKDLSGFYKHFLKQTVGEEKVPVFGERGIKQEILSDEEGMQQKCSVKISGECEQSPLKHLQSGSENELSSIKNKITDKTSVRQKEKVNETDNMDKDSDNVEIETDSNESECSTSKFKENKTSRKNNKQLVRNSDKYSDKNFDNAIKNRNKSNIELSESNLNDGDDSSKKKSIRTDHNRLKQKKYLHTSESSSSESEPKPLNCHSSAKHPIKKIKESEIKSHSNRHDSDSSNDEKESGGEHHHKDKNDADSQVKKEKINIYAKRTVGDVFVQTQARYFQRMAEKAK